ncbi:MAG: SpoIIE family protein phosphatase [Candidatus Omnitrophica bacterium]|nr:SpoIIE family protein phosphatase [Candidatus Omnitrophota bacterium]
MTIAFEPYAFNEESLYYAPYFYKNNEKIKFTQLGNESYQYFDRDWYHIPKTLGKSIWSEPYYDDGGGNIVMSTYSVPFYKDIKGVRKFMGIVTADVSLSWLREIISAIKIGKTGYGFLISQKGIVVTHPDKDFIINKDFFLIEGDQTFFSHKHIECENISSKHKFEQFYAEGTKEKVWILHTPVPTSGWSLGIVFPEKELMNVLLRLNSVVIGLGVAGFLVLLAVIFFISETITKPLRSLVLATKDIARGNLNFKVPRIKAKDEVGQLAEAFVFMKGALKGYIKRITSLAAREERIESELKIAHDIQMKMLPKEFPLFFEKKEIDVHAVLEPAKEVGGDFYDFFFIDKERLCFVIADISGKGVPAALFMTVAKTLIKAAIIETKSPAKTLKQLNKEFSENNYAGIFLTAFCGILNIQTGKVVYANGGHNFPLIISEKKKKAEFLEKGSFPAIGLEENSKYKDTKIVLSSGDTFFAYTDGVTEAFNKEGEMFSEERLQKEIGSRTGVTCQNLSKKVMEKVKKFSKGVSQSDDITIIALKYLKEKE